MIFFPGHCFKLLFFINTAIDLLEKMLDIDPDTRISVDEALKHPYIIQYHDPEDEPTADIFDSSFEALGCGTEGWRSEFHFLYCFSYVFNLHMSSR